MPPLTGTACLAWAVRSVTRITRPEHTDKNQQISTAPGSKVALKNAGAVLTLNDGGNAQFRPAPGHCPESPHTA